MRSDEANEQSFGWLFTGWRGAVVGLFAVLSCLLAVSLAFDQTVLSGLVGSSVKGDIGLLSTALVGKPGRELVTGVTPAGSAARERLAPGMVIGFDHAYEAHADLAAGRRIGLVAGIGTKQPRHVVLTALPADHGGTWGPDRIFAASVVFAAWFSVILGTIALVLGWRKPSALAFALGEFSYITLDAPPSWATTPLLANGYLWISAVPRAMIVCLLVLPVVVYAERLGRPGRGWIAALGLLFGTVLGFDLLSSWCSFTDARYPLIDEGELPLVVCATLGMIIGLYWAWRGWRDAVGADQGRYATLIVTSSALLVLACVGVAINLTGDMSGSPWQRYVLMAGSNVIIPVMLAYAVLRHRVIDLGFALNRTVVYASFSAILLGSFGLIEWGVEHLLPEEWVKASPWIDAGAAVLVYLAFHRVHGAVEQRVEAVFFRQWQESEEDLRRFVASAAYFEDETALARGFADALEAFGGGTNVAIYRRHDCALDKVAGNWDTAPRHFRDDNPAFALLRAERVPLDLDEMRTDLPGILALPMLDHGVLAGLVLLDLKGSGALYRPDEVTLLGWAAHDVGLALAALHAGLVETENRLLKAQLVRLGSIIGDRFDRATV